MASDRLLAAAAAAAVALAVGGAAPASALEGLQVTPTRIDTAVQRGDRLPPVRVTNNAPLTVAVDVAALRAGQELSGLPDYRLDAAARREGRRFLRVLEPRFTLRPRESRLVRARVVGGPQIGRGAYGVLLVSGRARDPEAGDEGAVVAPVVRLAANVLLRFSGRARPRGELTDLRAEQSGPRRLRFLARLRNRGSIHGEPRGRLVIRDARGRARVRAELPAGNVLPGAEREYAVDVRRVLPPGEYTAVATAMLGPTRSRRKLRFRLVGPNELPTPALQLVALEPPEVEAGRAYAVRFELRNAGSAPAAARGELTVGPQGGRTTERRQLEIADLAPGRTVDQEVELPPVAAGSHQITVRFRDGDRVVAERSVTFTTGAARGLVERILDWMAAHLLVVFAGFGTLLALVVLGVAMYVRSLQRRLRNRAPA